MLMILLLMMVLAVLSRVLRMMFLLACHVLVAVISWLMLMILAVVVSTPIQHVFRRGEYGRMVDRVRSVRLSLHVMLLVATPVAVVRVKGVLVHFRAAVRSRRAIEKSPARAVRISTRWAREETACLVRVPRCSLQHRPP